MRREFLQLADKYDVDKHSVANFFISEKLDGTRCFWDGGLSRGMRTEDVPWASITDPKTGKRKAKIKPISTGLWSRYGNPIIAPDAFLNQLPICPLDGELWAGRGNFQLCRSICGGDSVDPRFMSKIVFAVYSSPPLYSVFATGEIKNSNMVVSMDYLTIENWVKRQLKMKTLYGFKYALPGATFADELKFLNENLDNGEGSKCYLHKQIRLGSDANEAAAYIETLLTKLLDLGGEGVVLRDPNSIWTPKRHKGILKYKPYSDAEGTVIGFTSGRETDKGSKHLGRIGALILDYEGKRLELSGLTDVEREFASGEMGVFASANPGVDMPDYFQGRSFKKGQSVTFRYRELTDGGLPKEARFFRKRDVE
jgi:DNA ligase-1